MDDLEICLPAAAECGKVALVSTAGLGALVYEDDIADLKQLDWQCGILVGPQRLQ